LEKEKNSNTHPWSIIPNLGVMQKEGGSQIIPKKRQRLEKKNRSKRFKTSIEDSHFGAVESTKWGVDDEQGGIGGKTI